MQVSNYYGSGKADKPNPKGLDGLEKILHQTKGICWNVWPSKLKTIVEENKGKCGTINVKRRIDVERLSSCLLR